MIFSFWAVHSPSRRGMMFSGADLFFECHLLIPLAPSESGGEEPMGGKLWCLGEIHVSSGRGLRTGLEG